MMSCIVLQQLKLNDTKTIFDWDLMTHGDITGVSMTIKNFYAGMYSDLYESIWFTLGMMIVTT